MTPHSIGNLPQIAIAGTQVQQITYKGEPVVTFAMVDQVHQRPDGTARRNFNENRARFVESEDFLTITQPDEIRSLGFARPQGGTAASVVLVTRRGYLKLVKPMNDDRAWEVQGEMIDRYFATEVPKAIAVSATMREARMIFHEGQRMAKIAGLRGNQAVLAGQQMTVKLTGIDPLAMIGATFLAAPVQEVLLNATDIGGRLGDLKAQHVNAALIRHGYQTSFRDTKGTIHYEPTEKGRVAGGEMQDTGKKQGGVPVNQLRWRSGIVALLRSDMDGEGE